MTVNLNKKSRKRKLPTSKKNNQNDELNFEKVPRILKDGEENAAKFSRALLPIKISTGKIISQLVDVEPDIVESDDEKEIKIHSKPAENDILKTTKELLSERRKYIAEKKMQIGGFASTITSNPQSNLKMLRDLRLILDDVSHPESCSAIRKLVVASLCCIFIDIIPGYRIRERTEKEKDVKLTKEVKMLTDYEEGLLQQYKLYLKTLEKYIKGRKFPGKQKVMSTEAEKKLGDVAIHALKDLYINTSHFNFHSNIINVLIPIANNDYVDEIRKVCCDAIGDVFATDKQGLATSQTVEVMAKVAKDKGPKKLKPEFLETLMKLRINRVDYSMVGIHDNKVAKKKAAAEKKKLSRRMKKSDKKHKTIENELKEIAATEDQDEKMKLHTETIQTLFLIYFRILKHKKGRGLESKNILPSVLEGLAKFAHLININFFNDLLQVLQKLVTSEMLSLRENLHCIFTVFQILSGQGEVLNIDPIEFYKVTYQQLLYADDNNISLLINCLDLMLNKRRKQVTLSMLCAYIKRLSTVSLQLSKPQHVNVLMGFVKKLISSNSKSVLLFDIESQNIGSYDEMLDDPLYANAMSTVLWEYHLLNKHYVPDLRKQSKRLLKTSGK